MDFALDDDQLALRDAVRRWCDGHYPSHQRGNAEDATQSAQRHAGMADLGLLGLPVAIDDGGSGLGATEAMLVAQELGRALAGASWLSQCALVAPLLAAATTPAQRREWLPPLVQGSRQWALAVHETDQRYDLQTIHAHAQQDGDTWRLNGRKAWVLDGDQAHHLLALARVKDVHTAHDAVALFALSADQAGVTRQRMQLIDGRRAAHLSLHDAKAERLLGADGHAQALVAAALARGEAALCAESAGALEALLAMTCDHLKTRTQFGGPLARQQALQHQVADMALALEQVKSMACVAALATEHDDVRERDRLISAAKTLTSQLGRRSALAAIQMHGAMGMTDECRVGHYAKRLITNGLLLGDTSFHLRRFASHRVLQH